MRGLQQKFGRLRVSDSRSYSFQLNYRLPLN